MNPRLPHVDELEQLILRTDFSDEDAWQEMVERLKEEDDYDSKVYVDEKAWERCTPEDLRSARTGQLKLCFLFDAQSCKYPPSLQVVDLESEECPLPFRILPIEVMEVAAGINLGETDFEELRESGYYSW